MAYDPEATSQRIYLAALDEFAKFGIAGARVERIAQAAEANKQAIYAYYGDKSRLFDTVLARSMREVAESVPPDPDDLPGYVRRVAEYNSANPKFLRLMLWEALERGDTQIADEQARTEHYAEKADILGQATPPGVDSRVLTLALLALASWPLAVPQVTRMLIGDTDGASGELLDGIVTLVNGLSAVSGARDGDVNL